MALVCDATALVALGRIEAIGLLRHIDHDVVISPWVRERELRWFRAQIDRGLEEGWLRVQEPSRTEVVGLIDAVRNSFALDRGEAETLVLAGHQPRRPTTVLIDENEAFRFVQSMLMHRSSTRNWSLVCLADILHMLEVGGNIESASGTMQRLLDVGHYHWAPAVWTHYARQREQGGLIPVPRMTSQTGLHRIDTD